MITEDHTRVVSFRGVDRMELFRVGAQSGASLLRVVSISRPNPKNSPLSY